MSTSASDDADDDLEDDTDDQESSAFAESTPAAKTAATVKQTRNSDQDDDDKTAFKTGARVNFVMADDKGKKRVCGEVVMIDDEALFPKNMYNEKVPTFLLSYL